MFVFSFTLSWAEQKTHHLGSSILQGYFLQHMVSRVAGTTMSMILRAVLKVVCITFVQHLFG